MSSYTDDLQYLTRQTPYREEFPVDEAIKVGLEKQGRYDQGIQRIQASIDEVKTFVREAKKVLPYLRFDKSVEVWMREHQTS